MSRSEEWNYYLGSSDLCLFVEDETTRVFMNGLLAPVRPVAVHVVGSNSTVRTFVSRFKAQSAIGWIDRDFRMTSDDLSVAFGAVVQSQRHEIENYLLDARVLHAIGFGKSVEEVDSFMKETAKGQIAWLACRQVIFDLHERMQQGFLKHPALKDIPDLLRAEQWLSEQKWPVSIGQLSAQINQVDNLRSLLTLAHARFQQALTNGVWNTDFSGKEILHQVYDQFKRGGYTLEDYIHIAVEQMIDREMLPGELVSFSTAVAGL